MNWALPLGISFYTFHMLSVMIDVYRGEWTHRISFRAWWLYVTFFPHMIAGPILRASELVEQLEKLQPLKAADVKFGALIFMAVSSRRCCLPTTWRPWQMSCLPSPRHSTSIRPGSRPLRSRCRSILIFPATAKWPSALRCFGVVLPRNFLYPYTSRSVREFWQRWHITLSRWLRDYLYISLGGNRRGKARNLANLMITMLLGGLWHGAAWTFVFWGFLHGTYLVLHRLLLDIYARLGVFDGSFTSRAPVVAGLAGDAGAGVGDLGVLPCADIS